MSAAPKARARHDDPTTGAILPNEVTRRFRMRSDNVLVLMDWIRDMRKEEKSASGLLVLPGTKKPDNREAVPALAVDVGPGSFIDKWLDRERGTSAVGSRVFLKPDFAAGDRVLIDKSWSGDAVMIDGLEHRIVRIDNVIGVIEGE
jgi:co-chaperonin GroES (HSP10)